MYSKLKIKILRIQIIAALSIAVGVTSAWFIMNWFFDVRILQIPLFIFIALLAFWIGQKFLTKGEDSP